MKLKINGKQIKIYALIAVSILFLGTGYFRFFHKKASPVAPVSLTPALPTVQAVVPQDMVKGLPDNSQIEPYPVHQPTRTTIRNIFAPGKSQSRAKFSEGEQMLSGPGSTLKLSGAIVDGGRPIAIINGRFLRTGQWIDGFQVAKITKNGVLLRSESQELFLKVLSNAENK